MSPEEQALSDCKYGASLSYSSVRSFIGIWLEHERLGCDFDEEEKSYLAQLKLIEAKLETDECLLK